VHPTHTICTNLHYWKRNFCCSRISQSLCTCWLALSTMPFSRTFCQEKRNALISSNMTAFAKPAKRLLCADSLRHLVWSCTSFRTPLSKKHRVQRYMLSNPLPLLVFAAPSCLLKLQPAPSFSSQTFSASAALRGSWILLPPDRQPRPQPKRGSPSGSSLSAAPPAPLTQTPAPAARKGTPVGLF
jgi:hypothetical protein